MQSHTNEKVENSLGNDGFEINDDDLNDVMNDPNTNHNLVTQIPGLYSWGSGSHGQLGQGATKLSPIPQVVETLINEHVVPMEFSCGDKHVAMLSEDGVVWTWGCVLGLGRPIPLKNDVVCMTKAERGGYVQLSPPRRLKEPEGDPYPGAVTSLNKYPIGKAISVAAGLDFTIVATRRCFDPPPAKTPPSSPRHNRTGIPIEVIKRKLKKNLQENIQQVLTFDQHEHGTIIDIVEEGGKHDILDLHLSKKLDVDLRRPVPKEILEEKKQEIEAKKIQDAENKRMKDEYGWSNDADDYVNNSNSPHIYENMYNEFERLGDTALHVGSRLGHMHSIEVLLKHGANVHLKNYKQYTPLEEAVEQKRWGCIQTFIFDKRYKHASDLTILYASKRGYNDVVGYAIKHGGYVDFIEETDKLRQTPIMWASRNGFMDTVRLLYENGSNIELQDINTERAIDFSRIEGHGHIADALQKWTRKRIRDRRKLKKLEAKFGRKVNEDGKPIEEEEVPETVEEVRRMRYKVHPICKLCNLQSWNDRKNKKKGWCPGFEPHTDIEVHYCRYCLHHFKEHRWPRNHPVYLKYKKDFPDEFKRDELNVDFDEDGNEIHISVPQNSRYETMADVGDYSEDYLQNLAQTS